jgi:cytochrome P450
MTTSLNRKAPTAPGELPVLGHSLSLLRPDRVGYFTALRSIGDLVKIKIGARPYVLLNSPELVRDALLEQGNSFDRGRIFEKARPYVGDGLFTSQGTEHLRQRRSVQPAFHHARLDSYAAMMAGIARRHVSAWQPGDTLNADHEMHVLASEIIGQTMFQSPQAREVIQLCCDELPTLVQGLGVRTVLPDFFTRLPLPVNRRYDAACANFRDAARRLVDSYRESGGGRGDFVSMLMEARDAKTGVAPTDTEIRDQIMTLLISAIETPATTLTWALYELARLPEVRAQLEEEADRVFHGDVDVAELRVTEAFVLENLRLHHPLWMLMRRAVRPVMVGGVHLEAGTEVIYSPAAMHRDPATFPDPLRIRPERWLGAGPSPEMQRAFVPFGLGRRQCMGDAFAMIQMKISVAAIAASRRLSLPAGFCPKTVTTSVVRLAELPMIVGAR